MNKNILNPNLLKKKNILIYAIIFSTLLNSIGYSFFYFTKTGYPLVSFMSSPVGRFDDFYNNLFNPNEFLRSKANFVMYPLSIFLYKMFSISNIHLAALVFFFLMSSFLFWSLGRLGSSILFLVLVLVSYPYHFTIARGNNEIFLVALAAIIFKNIESRNYKKSTIFLFILLLFEPYPYYILIFFLYPKKYRTEFLKLVIYAGVAIATLTLNSSARIYFKSLILDGSGYVSGAGPGSTLHSSSLSGLIQYFFLIKNQQFPYELISFQIISRAIPIVGSLIILFFFTKYRERIDIVTSSILIVGGWTLISGNSFDYRLLHFFIPLAFLLNELKSQFDYLLIFFILILFAPKPFIWIKALNNPLGETLGSVVNPVIILLIIFITILRFSNIQSLRSKGLNKARKSSDFNREKNRDLN